MGMDMGSSEGLDMSVNSDGDSSLDLDSGLLYTQAWTLTAQAEFQGWVQV